jgi:hypothetical protein
MPRVIGNRTVARLLEPRVEWHAGPASTTALEKSDAPTSQGSADHDAVHVVAEVDPQVRPAHAMDGRLLAKAATTVKAGAAPSIALGATTD